MQENSFQLLLGHVIAMTYAVDVCIKHSPEQAIVLAEIAERLDSLSASMLSAGAKESADGVERIRMALLSGCSIAPGH